MNTDNIILVGMPGAGKSTVGVVLAKNLGYQFLDSDIIIQNQYGKLLQQIIEERGTAGFWQVENDVNAGIFVHNSVIATGGSAVYGKEAMEHFRKIGTVVYLQLSYFSIQKRLGDLSKRGVTIQKGQTLKDLYWERVPLYEKYAHITVDCRGKKIREIVTLIANEVNKREKRYE